MSEEQDIFDAIYKYYPMDVDRYSAYYDKSKEHIALMNKLHIASHDERWNLFLG